MTRPPAPSRFAERVLAWSLRHPEWRDAILGDLREEFADMAARRGRAAAARWHWRQAGSLALAFAFRRTPHAHRRSPMPLFESLSAIPTPGSFGATAWQTVRHAWRAVVHRPVTAGVVVLALALGLAANATIFSLADAIVLRPFRMPGVDRLAVIVSSNEELLQRESVAPADFLEWQREARAFSGFAAIEWWTVSLTGRGGAEKLAGFLVSPGYFSMMGIRPQLGRWFAASDAVVGAPRRVVVADALWRTRLGSDPHIVGRSVRLNGEPYEVVGVAPATFDLPMGSQVWAPLAFDAAASAERARGWLTVVGRLRDGVTLEQADAEMATIAARQRRDHPATNAGRPAKVHSFTSGMGDAGAGSFVAIWQAAALILLLIACANVANLLLVQGGERQREIALRLALGAGRARLASQLLLEGGILASLGAAAAVPLAYAGLLATRAAFPAAMQRFVPGWQHLHVQPSTLAVTALLAAAATVLAALVPALQSTRGAEAERLQRGGRTTTGGRTWLRTVFASAQVALAVALVATSAMTVASARRAVRGPLGFDASGLVTGRIELSGAAYEDAARRRQVADRITESLARSPAILDAGLTSVLPYGGFNQSRKFWPEGTPLTTAEAREEDFARVTPGYFRAMRIPRLAGRGLQADDRADTRAVAVVSRALADRYWPRLDPIGRRFRLGDGAEWLTVVGVVGNVTHDWFLGGARRTVYRPIAQDPPYALAAVARTPGEPGEFGWIVRSAIASADPDLAATVQPMAAVIVERTAGIRYAANALTAISVTALLLSLIGVYSLVSYTTSRRTQEIGIRTALGASPSHIARLTMAAGARIAVGGAAVGLLLAFGIGRVMENTLFGTISLDMGLALGVAVLLGVVALVAGAVPARRAATIDPTIALRAE